MAKSLSSLTTIAWSLLYIEMNTMPPPYSKGGYSRLPQSDSQYGYRATPSSYPPSSYAPAPPVMQQQSSNTVSVLLYAL